MQFPNPVFELDNLSVLKSSEKSVLHSAHGQLTITHQITHIFQIHKSLRISGGSRTDDLMLIGSEII